MKENKFKWNIRIFVSKLHNYSKISETQTLYKKFNPGMNYSGKMWYTVSMYKYNCNKQTPIKVANFHYLEEETVKKERKKKRKMMHLFH